MEIRVENLNYFYKEKRILKDISFVVDSSTIVGLYGKYKSLLLEILDFTKNYKGNILVNNELVDKSNTYFYQQQIGLISQEDLFLMSTVEEEMKFIVEKYNYKTSDVRLRMLDSLKLVGLSSNFLKRKIDTLSKSEKTLIKIACVMIVNPKVILFDDIFGYLSYIPKKKVLQLIKKLATRKDRLIIIASNDVDLLYQFTDKLIILDNGEVDRIDKTSSVFKDISYLESNKIDIPYLIEFTNLAKERKVKLSYHRDILDLIKDVYKHV